jgi:hypothetical protein
MGRNISQTHFLSIIFEGSVNKHTYSSMLRDWLVPQLEHMNLIGKVWFQQDGAPAHYAISVREYLSDVFRDKWIGSGSAILAAPLEWPPRCHGLSSGDNAL